MCNKIYYQFTIQQENTSKETWSQFIVSSHIFYFFIKDTAALGCMYISITVFLLQYQTNIRSLKNTNHFHPQNYSDRVRHLIGGRQRFEKYKPQKYM